MSLRNVLRNTVLSYLPPKVAHRVNMWKNVRLSALEPEMRIIPKLVRPDSVVIDIGANLGLYTEILATKARAVLACEPNPVLAAYLREVLGGQPKVKVIEVALSSDDGVATLRIPRFSSGKIGALDAYGSIENKNDFGEVKPISFDEYQVARRRLDDIAADEDDISFIKIDVEGHEGDVLSGAMATIRKHQPILMIEIEPRHNGNAYDSFDVMRDAGYRCYCLTGGSVQPIDRQRAAAIQSWNPDLPAAGQSAVDPAIYNANFFFIPAGLDGKVDLSG